MGLSCTKNDLIIKQNKTGLVVNKKPEFTVSVLNACPCLQGNIKLDCHGFQTVEKEDPVQMNQTGGECLLVNGSTVAPFSVVSFNYAWDTQFPFKPLSSEVDCK